METNTLQPLINDRYKLLQLLGAGSMGQVYRALDRRTGDVVALKRVMVLDAIREQERQVGSADDCRALTREFRVLASLHHPHIVNVIDFDLDEGDQPFYTMDYLVDAQPIIAYGQGLPLEQKIELLLQMFDALAYLHQRDILHRDLKPDNVMIVQDRVKLLDFGLSAGLTNAGYGLQGTVAYMAPELLQGKPPSKATDLYACGVIAYELLTERHPFNVRNVNRLMLDILYAEPDLAAMPDDPNLRDFVGQLLAKEAVERPLSADSAIDLLLSSQQLAEH